MIAQPAGDCRGEAGIVERQHALRDRRALGPDDGGDVGRTAVHGVGAGAHRQLRERAGRQEVLQRRVVVRTLVADGADDAGLVVGQLVTGMPAARRSGELRPSAATTRRQSIVGPPAMRTVAPSSRRSTSAAAGANTRSAGNACMCALSATRRLRASTRWPNGGLAGLAVIEVQEQR